MRDQSFPEEIANSLSHGVGLVAAIVGTPFLINHAISQGDSGLIVGTSIFSATVIILYAVSTLYHAIPAGKTKLILISLITLQFISSLRGHTLHSH